MRLAVTALVAVACGAPVYLPKEPPPLVRAGDDSGDTGAYAAPPCSTYSATTVTLEVTNGLETTLNLFWRDLGCAEVLYGVVPPGAVFAQPSYEDHVWVVRDLATGELVDSLVLDAAPVQPWQVE